MTRGAQREEGVAGERLSKDSQPTRTLRILCECSLLTCRVVEEAADALFLQAMLCKPNRSIRACFASIRPCALSRTLPSPRPHPSYHTTQASFLPPSSAPTVFSAPLPHRSTPLLSRTSQLLASTTGSPPQMACLLVLRPTVSDSTMIRMNLRRFEPLLPDTAQTLSEKLNPPWSCVDGMPRRGLFVVEVWLWLSNCGRGGSLSWV
jgi:hypothetical protein